VEGAGHDAMSRIFAALVFIVILATLAIWHFV
jgi:hypothetical protein